MDKLFTTQDIEGTKRENSAGADLSPIRSGFERKLTLMARNRLWFLNARFRKINNFISLEDQQRTASLVSRQRLRAKRSSIKRASSGIQHVVRLTATKSTCSREQKLNLLESLIRRRFVPDSFQLLNRSES